MTYVAEKIRAGQVLGMPTDTFYGLAADPFNLHAVDRIYEIKTRSRHKPLSLLIESVDQAADLAWPVPEIFYLLARRFWPGPLTIIVKADPKLPLKVTANTGNVALRVPAAEIPLAIIRAAGLPITATSANLHGESECTSAHAGPRPAGRLPAGHRGWRPVSARHAFHHRRSDQRRWRLAPAAARRHSRGADRRIAGPGVVATAPGEFQLPLKVWIVILAAVVAAGVLLYTAAQIMREAGVDEPHAADAIVVFGAAEYVGHPSPVYRARLDHAYDLFERGLAPVIITTGGAGKDPRFSEGQVGRDYLEGRGVPDVNLIAETQGDNTDQSAQRVAIIMRANEMHSALLVSDAYHLYRAKQMMEREGVHGVHLAAARLSSQDRVRTLDGRPARELQLHAVSGACEVGSFRYCFQLCASSSQSSWQSCLRAFQTDV